MRRIFISHSSRDDAFAAALKARLAEHGHDSFFLDFDAVDGIAAGAAWQRELYQRVVGCQAMIVVCSRAVLESKWCFVEMTWARSLGKPVFPVRIDDAPLEVVIADLQAIDFTRDEEQAYARLLRGLADEGLDPAEMFSRDPNRPPYPGLLSFEEEDAAIFFGRGDEVASGRELLNRVHHFDQSRVVMVLGASGTGKSSLVRAGLIPRLRRDRERWIIAGPFRPRSDPAGEAAALSRAFGEVGVERSAETIAAALRQDEDALARLAIELRRSSNRPAVKVLVVVDQFEELLGGDPLSAAGEFLARLRRAAEHPDAPVIVLGTMRSDFLEAFQNSRRLLDLHYEVLSVGPMSETDIAEVIEGPASQAEIELDPKLVATLVEEARTQTRCRCWRSRCASCGSAMPATAS